jgi:hypothetical protein
MATMEEKKVGTSGPSLGSKFKTTVREHLGSERGILCQTNWEWQNAWTGNFWSQIATWKCTAAPLLSCYAIHLSSALLRATSDYQLFFSFNNVFMWVSIIHHYLCQCQI